MKTRSLTAALCMLLSAGTALAQRPPRVAVVPFLPIDGSDPRHGARLAERLSERSGGRAVAVGEDELTRLLGGRRAAGGSLDPAQLRRLGRMLNAEAILAGAFVSKGGELVVKARLVEVASGKVSDAPARRLPEPTSMPGMWVPVPELDVEAPDPEEEGAYEAPRPRPRETCERAHDRVDALEAKILDIKARYWALQLRRGVPLSGLKFNPGSTISDAELKAKFYGRMHDWMKQEVVPELTPLELKGFAEIDEQAFKIARKCAIL